MLYKIPPLFNNHSSTPLPPTVSRTSTASLFPASDSQPKFQHSFTANPASPYPEAATIPSVSLPIISGIVIVAIKVPVLAAISPPGYSMPGSRVKLSINLSSARQGPFLSPEPCT